MVCMELREKALYIQIHPAKIVSDWVSAVAGLILLWDHALYEGIVVAILPSVALSFLMFRYAKLEPYRDSAFGQYFGRHMGRVVAWARVAGLVPLGVGAWEHTVWLMIIGALIVLLAWTSALPFLRGRGRTAYLEP